MREIEILEKIAKIATYAWTGNYTRCYATTKQIRITLHVIKSTNGEPFSTYRIVKESKNTFDVKKYYYPTTNMVNYHVLLPLVYAGVVEKNYMGNVTKYRLLEDGKQVIEKLLNMCSDCNNTQKCRYCTVENHGHEFIKCENCDGSGKDVSRFSACSICEGTGKRCRYCDASCMYCDSTGRCYCFIEPKQIISNTK